MPPITALRAYPEDPVPAARDWQLFLRSIVFWPLVGPTVMQVDAFFHRAMMGEPQPGLSSWDVFAWAEWAILGPLVFQLAVRVPYELGRRARFWSVHVIGALVTAALHSAVWFAARSFVLGGAGDSGETLAVAWLSRLDGKVEINILAYVLTVVGAQVILHTRRAHAHAGRAIALERRIADVELDAMKVRLRPELFAQALIAIEEAITVSPPRAETLISRFSRFLRQSLADTGGYRTLDDELDLVRSFVATQTLIAPHSAQLRESIPEAALDRFVPASLLLPVTALLLDEAGTGFDILIEASLDADEDVLTLRWTKASVVKEATLLPVIESARRRMGPGEAIAMSASSEGATTVTYTIVESARVAAEREESDEEERSIPHEPRRIPIAAALTLVLVLAPAEQILVNSVRLGAAWLLGRSVSPQGLWAGLEYALIAAPVALFFAWLTFRTVSRPLRGWVPKTILLGVATISVPALWLTALSSLGAAISGAAFWPAARRQLLATYRSTDFLIFMAVSGVIAYERYFASERRHFENTLLDTQLMRMHADVLKLQLNPHFLFNALNSVLALLDDQPERAAEMTAMLRRFLERVLQKADRAEIPLREELELAAGYLDIERIRFGKRLAVDIDVDERALSALVPNLLLQPLVENAVRHGLAPRDGGRVTIAGTMAGDRLQLEVRDNGGGAGDEIQTEGVGLRNTRLRLRHLYGDACKVTVDSGSGTGYSVAIALPLTFSRSIKDVR
jgi:sensor histidine kinase YesM